MNDQSNIYNRLRLESISIVLLLVSIYLLYGNIFINYILNFDDYALIYYSQNDSLYDFFKKGFTEYFIVYPEWTTSYTNYIRPLANLHIKALTQFVDLKYINIAFIVIQCIVLFLSIFFIRKNIDRNSPLILLILMTPLFITNYGYTCLAFHHETICAIFGLMALIAYIYRYIAITSLLLILAVFTKETGFFLTLGIISLEILQRNRNFRNVFILLVPALAWVAMRLISGALVTEMNVLALQSLNIETIKHILSGLFMNPLNFDYWGLFHINEVLNNRNKPSYFLIVITALQALTAIIFYYVFILEGYRRLIREKDFTSNESKIYILLCCLIAIYAAFSLPARYGYFLIPLLFVFLLSRKYCYLKVRKLILAMTSICWGMSLLFSQSFNHWYISNIPAMISSTVNSFNEDVSATASSDKKIAWISFYFISNPISINNLLRNRAGRLPVLFNYRGTIKCNDNINDDKISYTFSSDGNILFSLPECIRFIFPLANKLYTLEDIEAPFIFDKTGIQYKFQGCINNNLGTCRSLEVKNSPYDEIHIIQPNGEVDIISLTQEKRLPYPAQQNDQ